MSTLRTMLAAIGMFFLAAGVAYPEENWPTWRGPNYNGVSDATGLPETWSENQNIVWKTALPSWAGSSPIVWEDRIFLTSPSKPEPGQADTDMFSGPGGDKILLLCVSKKDGTLLWERELDTKNRIGRKGNCASPSPVCDGKLVFGVTGAGTVAAFTLDGDPVWTKDLQKEFGPIGVNFVYGSSPILYDNKLFVQVLHGFRTDDPSYLVAFDAATGEKLWRVERPTGEPLETPDAYNTPALLRSGDSAQIIVCGGGFVSGHDPKSGAEVWRAGGLNPNSNPYYRTIASPVAVDGIVYAPTRQRPLLAVRGGGHGDVSNSHLAWKWDRPYGPDVPSPACDGLYFYMVDDKGVATCLDAKTGAVIWGPEHTARGAVSASPLIADGKVYITNESGTTTVLSAGTEFKVIATNSLPGQDHTLSSFAVSGHNLFLRTPSFLYCIGKP